MKKLILALFLGTNLLMLQGQSFDFQYDHYSFDVKDLATVGAFYAQVLQLEEIPHPTGDKGFRWFKVHGNSQLHLIGKDSVAYDHPKSVHLCLATQNLDKLIVHLEANGIPYWDWPGKENAVTNRADGVRQIYIKDPENNWVEINTSVHL